MLSRYLAATHKVLEVAGYAPALLGHEPLPGPWQMVIMEYLNSASTWDDSMRKPLDELCKAVETLHKADFVHGDLRPPNILVQNDKVRFKNLLKMTLSMHWMLLEHLEGRAALLWTV
jgi:tRNA A-37 threonylcarbamoyl transferase component Bud32